MYIYTNHVEMDTSKPRNKSIMIKREREQQKPEREREKRELERKTERMNE